MPTLCRAWGYVHRRPGFVEFLLLPCEVGTVLQTRSCSSTGRLSCLGLQQRGGSAKVQAPSPEPAPGSHAASCSARSTQGSGPSCHVQVPFLTQPQHTLCQAPPGQATSASLQADSVDDSGQSKHRFQSQLSQLTTMSLRQALDPLCASVSLSVKWDCCEDVFPSGFFCSLLPTYKTPQVSARIVNSLQNLCPGQKIE